MRKLLLPLCVLCALCGEIRAVDPHLNAIAPFGGQRGTDVIATFGGANLNDFQEVVVYYPGITVSKTEVLNKDQLRVTLKLAADCRLGEHLFRIRTTSGISEARTFWVGALPVVADTEPNNEFDKPQPIPLNSTVQGSLGSEDVDYFVVECKKGQRLSVEVEGMRLGLGFFDPFVAILNDKRFELALGDDSAMLGQDSGCSIVCPNDGKYIVMIRDSAYTGAGQYRLHVGTFPRPTAMVPAGGKPGEELEVRFIGDPAGEIKQKVKVPVENSPLVRMHATTNDGVHPAGLKFRVLNATNISETTNASSPATAMNGGAAPCAFNGVISTAGETDYLRFTAKKGQTFDFHCYARRLGSQFDPVMHLSDANGQALATYRAGSDDSQFGPDSYFRFTLPNDGDYFVWVHDHLRKGGPEYFYRVEIAPIEARTNTTIPKVDGNNVANQDRQTLQIPKGNRVAFLATANRADWGGPATIGFDKLPPGVSVTADPVDAGLGQTPVVLEAKADAPLAGSLVDLQAKPVDAKIAATSKTELDVNYSIGLNNVPFHRHFTDRVAMAVTEAVPFSIEVVEPKAPLVQNGSMYLKVIAKRAPNFKGVINVYPLFTPPGTGIAGHIAIAENATEGLVYCNAAPNAAARKWKTCFIAFASSTTTPAGHKLNDPPTAISTGPVWVASQLFTLEVAPPFLAFAQERTAVEQGAKTQVVGKVTINAPFDGEAVARIIGLPAKVTAPEIKIKPDTKEIAFDVTTDKTSPAGKHGVYVQVEVMKNGEKLYHAVGGGELRIDVPLPPKVAAATPAPAAAAKPTTPPPTAAPMKRLTRLEQLRLEQEEREKAAKAGTPSPMPATPPKKEEKK